MTAAPKRLKDVNVRLNDDEKAMLDRCKRVTGMNTSDLIRYALARLWDGSGAIQAANINPERGPTP